MQKHSFACIHFCGQGDVPKVIEIVPDDRDILQKDTAEFFLNSGGTDFIQPLAQAGRLIDVSRYNKANVVFITDGQAVVEEKFLKEFLDLKKRKEFRVVSLLIQSGMKSTLEKFSDAVVSVKEMLDSEAEEVIVL
jgi:uncharacterized protein with von Willebrand factor type A (vWA) domain